MSPSTFDRVCQEILDTDPKVLWDIASMCDGHGILDPRKLVEAGLTQLAAEYFTETFKSDGTPKGTIYVEGKPVDQLEGIYGLRLLEAIAVILKVQYPSFMGRGYQAQAIQQALLEHLTPGSAPGSKPPRK